MKEIKLTKGKVTIVDDEDYEYLSQWKWQFNVGYASRSSSVRGKSCKIYMHRIIAHTPMDKETDHINRDKLDNRRKNLRICSSAVNERNKSIVCTNTSGARGVNWEKGRNKWRAGITYNYKYYNLGRYDNINDAIRAYNEKAFELFGELY
jgi:hypothetical protein